MSFLLSLLWILFPKRCWFAVAAITVTLDIVVVEEKHKRKTDKCLEEKNRHKKGQKKYRKKNVK